MEFDDLDEFDAWFVRPKNVKRLLRFRAASLRSRCAATARSGHCGGLRRLHRDDEPGKRGQAHVSLHAQRRPQSID